LSHILIFLFLCSYTIVGRRELLQSKWSVLIQAARSTERQTISSPISDLEDRRHHCLIARSNAELLHPEDLVSREKRAVAHRIQRERAHAVPRRAWKKHLVARETYGACSPPPSQRAWKTHRARATTVWSKHAACTFTPFKGQVCVRGVCQPVLQLLTHTRGHNIDRDRAQYHSSGQWR
jgi:hypothetical protein